MKSLSKASVLAVLASFAAPFAPAAAQLRLSSGAVTITVADQDPLDAHPAVGIIVYLGPVGPTWQLNVTVGVTKPVLGSSTQPMIELLVNSVGSGTLKVEFTDTQFSGSGPMEMHIGGVAFGSVTHKVWQGLSDIPFQQSVLLGTTTSSSSGGFDASAAGTIVGAGAYSLTHEMVITQSDYGVVGFDALLLTRFPTGPFTTFTPGGWGAPPSGENPGALLAEYFPIVYPVGVAIGGIHQLRFTSAAAIEAFLPQGGKPATLAASGIDPTEKLTVFAGHTLALQLAVDFSDAGVLRYGLRDLTVATGKLAGYTVGQVLALCHAVLGGTTAALPPGVTISDLNDIADAINQNFDGGNRDNGYLL